MPKGRFQSHVRGIDALLPVLFDFGIDVLSGCKVVEADRAVCCIAQGATFKQIDGIKLLSMRRKGN